MSLTEEVEEYKRNFSNKSDGELLLITHKNEQFCAAHIAAAQILQQRCKDKTDEQSVVGKCTNRLTLIILILTIIILFVTIGQFILSVSRIPQIPVRRDQSTTMNEIHKVENSK